MAELTSCPLCGHGSFSRYLDCKDHFLTQKEFQIVSCHSCGLRFTNPRPSQEELPGYYKSQDYISHSNVKKGFINKLYHLVRNHALRKKYKIVSRYSFGKKILDIGCGTGELLNHFRLRAWDVTGIEPDPGASNFARENYGLELTDLQTLQASGKAHFDVITMWHVLEHVNDLHLYLEKIHNFLNDNGTLIVAVPNSDSWDARHYESTWAAFDVPRHLYHFTQGTIKQLMERNSFTLIKIIPMKFDAFYISLLSEKYKTGRQQMLKGFLHGLYSNFYACFHQKNFSSLIFIFKTGQRPF